MLTIFNEKKNFMSLPKRNSANFAIIALGAFLAIKMIPAQVMAESRSKAKEVVAQGKPVNKVAALVIVLIWIGLAIGLGVVGYRLVKR